MSVLGGSVVEVERIFARCFFERYRTVLRGGGDEPMYTVSRTPDEPHLIVYRHDYVASAMHEVAHWCVAGPKRREKDDYGYWYAPDGRTPEQQREFERVEVKPQAMEWVFADAWGSRFELSADNLAGDAQPSDRFAQAVLEQKQRYLAGALPRRARLFVEALAARERGQPIQAPL